MSLWNGVYFPRKEFFVYLSIYMFLLYISGYKVWCLRRYFVYFTESIVRCIYLVMRHSVPHVVLSPMTWLRWLRWFWPVYMCVWMFICKYCSQTLIAPPVVIQKCIYVILSPNVIELLKHIQCKGQVWQMTLLYKWSYKFIPL